MQILKGDLSDIKEYRRAGYASAFIGPAPSTRKWSQSTVIVWRFGREPDGRGC